MSNFDIALGILLIAEYRPVLNRLRNVDILLDSCNHGILSFLGIVLFFCFGTICDDNDEGFALITTTAGGMVCLGMFRSCRQAVTCVGKKY